MFLFSSNNILATHLVPLPHASALSPPGLNISISASTSLCFDVLIVISWSHPAPVRLSLSLLIISSVIKILFDEDSNKEILKIQSDAGILESKKINNLISVNMGLIKNTWDKIPLSKEIDTMNIPIAIDGYSNGVAVNVGNPHVVFFGKSIKDTDLEIIGPRIENHELFPKKTNVEIVEVINPKLILMRVWERGVGITLACGSGACAAVYAAWKKGLIENNAEVKLEKGSLHINIINNEAIMTGPAEISYQGSLEI